jgi:RNA polymerase sigma-70 factor, ECF subfamily
MSNDNDNLSDTVLIQRFLAGDNAAFDVLYERYRLSLYSFLNRLLLSHREQVDDVFQQTWVKAVRNLPHYTDRTRFFAWLCRIAHNLAMDYFRRNDSSLQELPDYLPADTQNPCEVLHGEQLDAAIQRALSQLPPEQREVIRLRNDGVSFKEIAERKKISLNTALGRMHYAVNNLRKLLREFL